MTRQIIAHIIIGICWIQLPWAIGTGHYVVGPFLAAFALFLLVQWRCPNCGTPLIFRKVTVIGKLSTGIPKKCLKCGYDTSKTLPFEFLLKKHDGKKNS
jgi:hypothetical protein